MNRLSYLFLPLTAISVSACSSGKAKEEVKTSEYHLYDDG